MKQQTFDRNEPVYKNDAFAELVKDAIRFFNGTPVHTLPPPDSFLGTGVYALYYIGRKSLYKRYSELNRLSYDYPIYVGKAVPKGWRQARSSDPKSNHGIIDHIFRDGARTYPGHTGSDFDWPSKTIKAGGHGVPSGENMIRFDDGSVGYLTTFEAKRIQTFPDDFVIKGAWGEAMRQIGNAVPVLLAEKIGIELAKKIKTHNPSVKQDALERASYL